MSAQKNKLAYLTRVFGEDYAQGIADNAVSGLADYLAVEGDVTAEQADEIVASLGDNIDLSTEKKAGLVKAKLLEQAPAVSDEEVASDEEAISEGESASDEDVPAKKTSPKKPSAKKSVVAPRKSAGDKDNLIAKVESIFRTIMYIRNFVSAVDVVVTAKTLIARIVGSLELFSKTEVESLDEILDSIRKSIDDSDGKKQYGPSKFSKLLVAIAQDLLALAKEIDSKNYFGTLDVQIVGSYPTEKSAAVIGFSILSAGTFPGGKHLAAEGFTDDQIKDAYIVFLIPSAIQKGGVKAKSVRKGKVLVAIQSDIDWCRNKMSESNYGNVSFGIKEGQIPTVDGEVSKKEVERQYVDAQGVPVESIFINKNTLDQIQSFINKEKEKSLYYTLRATSNRKAKSLQPMFDPRYVDEKKGTRAAGGPSVYVNPFQALLNSPDYKDLVAAARKASSGARNTEIRQTLLKALKMNSEQSLLEAGIAVSYGVHAVLKYSLVKNGKPVTKGKSKTVALAANKRYWEFLRTNIDGTNQTVQQAVESNAAGNIEDAQSGKSQKMVRENTVKIAEGLENNVNNSVISTIASKLTNKSMNENAVFKLVKSSTIARPGAGAKDAKDSTDDMEIVKGSGVTAGDVRALIEEERQAVTDEFKRVKAEVIASEL